MIRHINKVEYEKILKEFPPTPIFNDNDNQKAIAMVKKLVAKKPTTETKAVAQILITLIKAYEQHLLE